MGLLDRLLGRDSATTPAAAPAQPGATIPTQPSTPPGPLTGTPEASRPSEGEAENQRAIARYQYLLRTAAPEELERVHTEAFAKLTPEQRQQVLADLSATLPAGEKVTSAEPHDLARAATRAELQQPGYLNSTFARQGADGRESPGGGMTMGKVIGGAMIGTIAGAVVASAASNLFSGFGDSPEAQAIGDLGDSPSEWAPGDAVDPGDDNASFFGSGGFFGDDDGDEGGDWI